MPGLQKIPKEDIMNAIAKIGPSQPIDIRKELKQGDTFLIGAMLSEMVADGTLQISKVRRGGSPFYYDPKVPERLDMISQYLNEKDRRTYAMLKEQRVMREDVQDPLVRVGLKNMPDFSKQVEIDGATYWRYYLVSEEEAKQVVKGAPKAEPKDVKKELQEIKQDMKAIEEKNKEVQKELKQEEKPKKRKKAKEEAPKEQEVPKETAPREPKPAKSKSRKKEEPVIMPDGAVMISPQEWLEHDTLYGKVRAFVKDMKIRDARVHKPHGELTCIITAQTPLGAIDTFIHAFNKKFTADDIKASLPRARELGLPIIILSVDAVPSKVTAAFKGMPNIIFKVLE